MEKQECITGAQAASLSLVYEGLSSSELPVDNMALLGNTQVQIILMRLLKKAANKGEGLHKSSILLWNELKDYGQKVSA